MKTIILLIALILCNLSFSCEILPNGNYIPCDITEKIVEAESRLNEAEVRYVESIKKYETTRHNAASKSFKQKLYSDIVKQKSYSNIAEQTVDSFIAEQTVDSEMIIAKQKADYEMLIAKNEYEKARRECGRIYALAKGEVDYSPVGKAHIKFWS